MPGFSFMLHKGVKGCVMFGLPISLVVFVVLGVFFLIWLARVLGRPARRSYKASSVKYFAEHYGDYFREDWVD